MSRVLWLSVAALAISLRTAIAVDVSPEKEKELIAILQTGAPADKALACKKLAIDGSKAAVPELAKLLPDPQLHSWARTALEAIPGPEANEALRTAAEKLEGKLLIGCINSLGIRRDVDSVVALTKRLEDKDAEVASAAALALGRIGTADATATLRKALASAPANVKSTVAEGCILCAERLHTGGKSADAIEIYDEVRKADLPKQRILEATRGAILARKGDGIPLLIEQLNAPDRGLFNIGLATARELGGEQVDKALAAELTRAKPDRAALILTAMADRKDVVLSAVVGAAKLGPREVRISAINALARVGDASCVSTLIDAASEGDPGLAEAAKSTLADLRGEKVDSQIVELLSKADAKSLPMVIELVGRRQISATPSLLKALDHSDATVRAAALTALGETVDLKGLNTLVSLVTSPKKADDAAAALVALKAASVRMPDRDACAAELGRAIEKAPAATKIAILDILGEVGGAEALKTVATAAKSDDPALQDNGSRVLGKWNGVDAAPVLLDLAKTGPAAYRVRVLRGYIGLARKFATIPDADRAEMCQKALEQSKAPEQKLVLDVLKLHPSKEGIALAIKSLQSPEVKDDATTAVLVIAQKLAAKKVDVSDQLAKAGLEKVKLEIVKAEYGAGTSQREVTDILRKLAGDLPLIDLPKSYNGTFGGDPASGQVKSLKVQYKLNGKAGEASFAEDAVIIFATPK